MSISYKSAIAATLTAAIVMATAGCSKQPEGMQAAAASTPEAAPVQEPIPRAPSTPNTPKNWAGPAQKIHAQALVDELIAKHPEVMSITIHATPPGETELYTMIAGSFPDRIGNQSSAGDVITVKKAVSQIEPKWGTPDWKKKVSTVLPLKDSSGKYLSAAMVIAFKTSPEDTRADTDFLAPGLAIRDGLQNRITNFDALFVPAQ